MARSAGSWIITLATLCAAARGQTVGVDLSVAVTPLYFASMAAERAALQHRAETQGPSAADYDRPDTITSLAMGALSLTSPLTVYAVSRAALRRGGGGTLGKVVLGVAVTAAAVTTAADVIAAGANRATEAGRRVHRQIGRAHV